MDFPPSGCPIRFAAGSLGDRWCLMIIRDLMFKNRKYYRDFLEAGEGISTNILADRLLRLESVGVISKSQDPEHGKRYIYELTEKGIALLPVMVRMIVWAAEFDEETEMPKAFVKRLQGDPVAVEAEMLAMLKERLDSKTNK